LSFMSGGISGARKIIPFSTGSRMVTTAPRSPLTNTDGGLANQHQSLESVIHDNSAVIESAFVMEPESVHIQ
jgi:hypothetical protein